MFTVGHFYAPYEWITLISVNTSETGHNPGIYQVLLSDFQLAMSFTSFPLNSLHAGSTFYILELWVSDCGDGRHTMQRGSPPRKRVCHSECLNRGLCLAVKSGADTGLLIFCFWKLKWDVWECVQSLCWECLNNNYKVWKKKSRQWI